MRLGRRSGSTRLPSDLTVGAERWLVEHGIPTVTFGAGQNAIHTVEEWVDLDLYVKGCRMALALATG